MKNRILKILGVAVTLAMVLTLAAGFAAAPAAANPGETLNQWYTFDYPKAGSAGDWFRQGPGDEAIGGIGPIAKAINGDLYASVSLWPTEAELDTAGAGTAVWSTDYAHSGAYSAKLTAPTSSDYGKVTLPPITAPFSTFSAPSFYYRISSDAVPTTENIEGTWPIYVRSGDTVTQGYLSPYPVIHISDGTNEHWIIGQPWAESTQVGWTLWDNSQASGHWSEACWHNESFTDLAGGPVDAGWEPLSAWQNEYPDYDVVDVGIGLGFFTVTGQQSVYVDDITVNGEIYSLDTAQLFKSTDGGHTWAETNYSKAPADGGVAGGRVSDMVCSSIDENVVYVTDGCYVYKTEDGGDTWDFVGKDSLETALTGHCGCAVCGGGNWRVITSLDVTYDRDGNPYVFIGTQAHTGSVDGPPDCYTATTSVPGSVYYIAEAGYPANWTDLNLSCYGGGGYSVYAVGCAPDWADSHETFVVVSNGSQTHVIYTKGTVCGWTEFAELKCDCTDSFGIWAASRIGFPDDWTDSQTLFVGVTTSVDYGGDVYMATDGDAIDMNVEGIETSCVGEVRDTDIISLDVMGDTDEASLIAGAFNTTDVYYSTDGGWSWNASEKNPTGDHWTYVIFYQDTALAATSGCDCAVSMSCGEEVGQYWNQISLIATDIDCVLWGDFSPGYLSADSHTMYMLTNCQSCCGDTSGIQSLFRYDGTYWDRVLSSSIAGSAFEWVEVSPDFLDTNCVYLGNSDMEGWRTTDAGCSWDKLTFPCAPRPTVSAAVVIDEETVIAGGAGSNAGEVYKTTRHGARTWNKYEVDTSAGSAVSFALEPGYQDPGSVLLGDSKSQVWISEDGGETWDLVGTPSDVFTGTYPTWVIFDPDYATNHTIYAAAGDKIARCIIDPSLDWSDQTWEDISYDYCGDSIDLVEASGIAVAGDTALYVADGAPYGYCGVYRSLNPTEEDNTDVVFENLVDGLDLGTGLVGLKLTADVSDEGCAENVLWSIGYRDCSNVWVWEDTLAQPVVLDKPDNAQKLTKADEATLSWNELCDADCYEVSLYAYCAECPDQKIEVSIPCTGDCCLGEIDGCELKCTTDQTCITVNDLDPGTKYYWQVRVCHGAPYLSKWSELRSFTTAMTTVGFSNLCSPACGSQDIILTPNFAWGAVEGATGYEVGLSTTDTFTAVVAGGATEVNAWVCPTTLDYATTYYWRVRAVKDTVYSDWTYCMFTTMPEPVAPTPPVVVQQVPPSPPPVINIPPAQMITPKWIYAIIGVGAALAIVVIVLIVRTRRPPA
jgi:hypothetical protein